MSTIHHLEFLEQIEANELPDLVSSTLPNHRLSRIRVTNLWDTSIGWDLKFDDDLVAFMIGKNGTGKTTFLELVDAFINGTEESRKIFQSATTPYNNRTAPRKLCEEQIPIKKDSAFNPQDSDSTGELEERFRYTLGRIAWSIDSGFWHVQRLAFSPFLEAMGEHQFDVLEFSFT